MTTTLLTWLLTYLLHSTVLLLAAWGVTRLLGERRLAWADLAWKTALCGGLLTATLQVSAGMTPLLGRLELGMGAAALGPSEVATADAASQSSVDALPASAHTWRAGSPPVQPPSPWSAALLAVWCVGAVVCLLPLLVATRRLTALLRDRRAASGLPLAALRRLEHAGGGAPRVELTVAPRLPVPIARGVLRPEICLPHRVATELPPEQQRAVLAHELAHHRRRDPLWLLGGQVLAALLWLQPLNRLAVRRLRAGAEILCDDWALRRNTGRLAFARCLQQVATWALEAPRGELSELPMVGMASEHGLGHRVRRVLAGEHSLTLATPRLALVPCLAVLALVASTAPSIGSADGLPSGVAGEELDGGAGRSAGRPVARAEAPVEGTSGGDAEGSVAGGVSGGVSAAVAGGVEGGVRGRPAVSAPCWYVDDRGHSYEVDCGDLPSPPEPPVPPAPWRASAAPGSAGGLRREVDRALAAADELRAALATLGAGRTLGALDGQQREAMSQLRQELERHRAERAEIAAAVEAQRAETLAALAEERGQWQENARRRQEDMEREVAALAAARELASTPEAWPAPPTPPAPATAPRAPAPPAAPPAPWAWTTPALAPVAPRAALPPLPPVPPLPKVASGAGLERVRQQLAAERARLAAERAALAAAWARLAAERRSLGTTTPTPAAPSATPRSSAAPAARSSAAPSPTPSAAPAAEGETPPPRR